MTISALPDSYTDPRISRCFVSPLGLFGINISDITSRFFYFSLSVYSISPCENEGRVKSLDLPKPGVVYTHMFYIHATDRIGILMMLNYYISVNTIIIIYLTNIWQRFEKPIVKRRDVKGLDNYLVSQHCHSYNQLFFKCNWYLFRLFFVFFIYSFCFNE